MPFVRAGSVRVQYEKAWAHRVRPKSHDRSKQLKVHHPEILHMPGRDSEMRVTMGRTRPVLAGTVLRHDAPVEGAQPLRSRRHT